MIGLEISGEKTKVMFANTQPGSIVVDNQRLEEVDSFVYLGSVISPSGSNNKDIAARIAKARATFKRLWFPLWRRTDISIRTKVRVYKASVRTVLLYAAETWALTKADITRLNGCEMNFLRQLAHVSWQVRWTNDAVRRYCSIEELHSELRLRRLRWLGHISRMRDGRYPKETFFQEPFRQWRRPVGRPRTTWRDCALEDTMSIIRPRDRRGNYKSWMPNSAGWKKQVATIAADREAWRTRIHSAA